MSAVPRGVGPPKNAKAGKRRPGGGRKPPDVDAILGPLKKKQVFIDEGTARAMAKLAQAVYGRAEVSLGIREAARLLRDQSNRKEKQ